MKISIILVTKNAGKQFAELLSKLHQQEPKPLEIIVIDSGSTDGTVEIASKNGCKMYEIPPQEFHHGKTRNYGASLALGDCVVFLSQDVAPVNNFLLYKLTLPLEENQVAGVYGRQIAYPDADPIEKFFYLHFYAHAGTIRLTKADCENKNLFYVKYAFTSDACAALRKSVWEQFKFSETVLMAEDKQWALDVLTAGYTLIYEPTAEVFHSHSYPPLEKLSSDDLMTGWHKNKSVAVLVELGHWAKNILLNSSNTCLSTINVHC